MATTPKPVRLDPFQKIVGVGWGNRIDMIHVHVGGRTEISQPGGPPPPKDLAMRVEIFQFQTFDPTTPPAAQVLVPGTLPPYPQRPPVSYFDPDTWARSIVFGSEPEIAIDSLTGTQSTESWAVSVAPTQDPYVILPEPIPNPFFSEADAQGWIAGFRARWPGWQIVDFVIYHFDANEPRSMTTNVRAGVLFINAKNLRRALPGGTTPFPPESVTIICDSNPNQGGYAVKTYRAPPDAWDLEPPPPLPGQKPQPPYLIDDKQLSVGYYYDEFENQVFVSPHVSFTVDFKTLKISSSIGPAKP